MGGDEIEESRFFDGPSDGGGNSAVVKDGDSVVVVGFWE